VQLGGLRKLKKSSDLIGIRTRDHPACSIVPQLKRNELHFDFKVILRNSEKGRGHINKLLPMPVLDSVLSNTQGCVAHGTGVTHYRLD
jgi:hypothetical protein